MAEKKVSVRLVAENGRQVRADPVQRHRLGLVAFGLLDQAVEGEHVLDASLLLQAEEHVVAEQQALADLDDIAGDAVVLGADAYPPDHFHLAAAELLQALPAELGHRLHGGLEILARIEFGGFFRKHLADGGGHRQAVVGVDVDLAHAVLDAALDLLDRDAPGRLDVAAVVVDELLQILGDRG